MNIEKKLSAILLGIIVIVAGLGYGAAALGFIEDFTIFFDGWWAVAFIMLPSFCSLFDRNSNKFWCMTFFLIGTALLLWQQDMLKLSLGKLCFAIIVIAIGFSILASAFKGNSNNSHYNGNAYTDIDTSVAYPKYSASFGECRPNYNGQVFAGCKCEAAFGQVVLDLRNAIITNECSIQATAAFGETEIILPQSCILDLHSSAAFGAVNNSHINAAELGAPILHIDANATFGTVVIR